MKQTSLILHYHYVAAHLNHLLEFYSKHNRSLLKAFMVAGMCIICLFPLVDTSFFGVITSWILDYFLSLNVFIGRFEIFVILEISRPIISNLHVS